WALTGHWHLPDAYNPSVATPVFMLFQYSLLETFGIHLNVLRYGAIFCALLMIGMLYGILRKEDEQTALLAALFAAVNFPLIIYNRLAFIENLLLVFIMGAAIILMKILKDRANIGTILLFWFLFALGYFTKASILFFTFVFITIIGWYAREKKIKIFIYALVCIAALSIIAYFLWISRYPDDWRYFQQLNVTGRFSLHPLMVLKNYAGYLGHLKLFEFMPVTYLLALYMLSGCLHAVLKGHRISPPYLLFSAWLFWGIVYLGFFAYSPPRYSTLLLLPVVALAALYCRKLLRQKKPDPESPLLIIIPAILLAGQCAFAVYRMVVYHQFYPSCFLPFLGWPVLFIMWRTQKGRMQPALAVTLLLTAIAVVQLGQIVRYHASMEYSLHRAMLRVSAIIRSDGAGDAVIVGDSAPLMAIEAAVPAIDIMYRQETLPIIVNRLKPNYLFLEDIRELGRLQSQVPGYFDRVEELARFPLIHNYAHGTDAVLYQIMAVGTD
ncbi:glycosyltransferase family 39 protein, partial [candidate division KSB1 bacterium]|nr:glycosyltransferase family 39 protein [candidate division KSB1 bacterium]